MSNVKYCSYCGSSVAYQIPAGDNRERPVCQTCQIIHYNNPKIVVGAVCLWQERILLCRRAIEPRKGFWTFPAGFLELHETVEEGACREALEEANAAIALRSLLAVYSLAHISQIQILFLAELEESSFSAGEESLEVKLFAWDEIPMRELAFPSVSYALAHARRMTENPALAPERRCDFLQIAGEESL